MTRPGSSRLPLTPSYPLIGRPTIIGFIGHPLSSARLIPLHRLRATGLRDVIIPPNVLGLGNTTQADILLLCLENCMPCYLCW
jgi:hypothetical protein